MPIGARVEIPLDADTPDAIAVSVGVGVEGFARAYAAQRPDLLIVLGDRFEMYAAAVAALPFMIPVAHLHGGELTYGAIDDALRHSMTKLSHLHFVATETFAQRVRQLGEEPWRVIVSGSPSLDGMRAMPRLTHHELEEHLGLSLDTPPLLVTFHPVTLESAQAEWQARQVVEALQTFHGPIIVTAPNEDTHGRLIRQVFEQFVAQHPRARFVEALGRRAYVSVMAVACAMVGNSSSGLIEAPSFQLPVVNVGTRQEGRLRAGNVIDVGSTRDEIVRGLRQVLDPGFRAVLKTLINPYGNGHAAETIVRTLRTVALDDRLLRKRFVDLSVPQPAVEPEVAHVA
jgi:UDP-hydrolysing UDP-N-acetyl-D-glucosamine 2-epimerase